MRGFPPTSSRLVARKERRRKRRLHEQKLREISNRKPGHRAKPGAWMDAGFDNAPPKTVGMRHLAVNAKRERLIEERCEEIERQNRLLLARMTQIMSSKGVFKRTTEKPPPGPRSLNIATRRKELLRIVSENAKILARINSVQPQYNVRKWEEEFEKQAAIRESLSNFYPDEFGNDAEATEAMRAAGVAHGGGGTARSGGKRRSPRAQSAHVSRKKVRSFGGTKSEGVVRSASAARKREKETRLDRVLLVSRERSGRYAAQRPGRARAKRGAEIANTVKGPMTIVPTRPSAGKASRKTGGRAGAVRAKAANTTTLLATQETTKAKDEAKPKAGATQDTAEAKARASSQDKTKNVTAPSPANKSNSSAEEKQKQEPKPEPAVSEPNQTEKAVPEAAEEPSESPVQEEEGNDDDFQFSENNVGAEALSAGLLRGPVSPAREEKKEEALPTEIEEDPADADASAPKAPEEGKKEAATEKIEEVVTEKVNPTTTPLPDPVPAQVEDAIEIDEDIVVEEERRWDGDEQFTKQEFLDFYGGTEEWDAAEPVVKDEPVLSNNLASTMSVLPDGWSMAAGMRIDGAPLGSPVSDFAAAVAEAKKLGDKCGGLNEEGGSFTLMKAGQALLTDANCTAYTASAP